MSVVYVNQHSLLLWNRKDADVVRAKIRMQYLEEIHLPGCIKQQVPASIVATGKWV
jgi:hypothetical protein